MLISSTDTASKILIHLYCDFEVQYVKLMFYYQNIWLCTVEMNESIYSNILLGRQMINISDIADV